MNILIAEDTPFLQLLNRQLMDRWGYDFDMASNGREAVDYALKNEGKYDLGLMDIEMPVMTGLEATRLIRQKTKYFPIMAYTSNRGYRRQCLECGFDAFVEKPASINGLFKIINELTVKSINCVLQDNKIILNEEMPVDKKHAEELRELAKQDLRKINIRGVGAHDLTIIVHKNVPYKISQDFIGNDEEVSIFLDRSPDRPAECHLYKSSCPMPTIFLKDDEYEEKRRAEDEILKDCVTMVVKSSKS